MSIVVECAHPFSMVQRMVWSVCVCNDENKSKNISKLNEESANRTLQKERERKKKQQTNTKYQFTYFIAFYKRECIDRCITN